jgi:hypothetical protein
MALRLHALSARCDGEDRLNFIKDIMMQKHRFKAKTLLNDVRSGVSPGEIMTGLGICLAKLSPMLDRLVEKGLTTKDEIDGWKNSWAQSPGLDVFLCPECGKPQFGTLIECLDCHVSIEMADETLVLTKVHR